MSIILTILCAFSSGAVGAMMGAMPSIIFMGFNAGSLYFLGQKYIDACYQYARERLRAEIQMEEP